jgi:hypothetical protein
VAEYEKALQEQRTSEDLLGSDALTAHVVAHVAGHWRGLVGRLAASLDAPAPDAWLVNRCVALVGDGDTAAACRRFGAERVQVYFARCPRRIPGVLFVKANLGQFEVDAPDLCCVLLLRDRDVFVDRRETKTSVGEHQLCLRNDSVKSVEVDWATGERARLPGRAGASES